MIRRDDSERGSGHLPVLIACIVLISIFAIGWMVAGRQPGRDSEPQALPEGRLKATDDATAGKPSEDQSGVVWVESGSGAGWIAQGGTPPECPDPLLASSPVNTAEATTVLLPGQYRGTHYKAHGGFRYDNSRNGVAAVKLPFDARLTGLLRYLEQGELQYLLTFQHACGYMLRFDHLSELSDTFTKIAETTPEPKADDTRSLPLQTQPLFKAGTPVASVIGMPKAGNFGLDIGIYDLRRTNDISRNSQWAALHANESSQTFHGVCWLTMLPKTDASKAMKLMKELPVAAKGASDYCTDAPGGSTLQYDSGRPPGN